MATNYRPESTSIDPNIVILVKSYLSRMYIERETDFKTTFLANFALTTPLTKVAIFRKNLKKIMFENFWKLFDNSDEKRKSKNRRYRK